MQYLVTGGAGFIGSNMREVAFVCARHNPLDGCPLPPGKPASQFIFEVRDCRKSSFYETAKFLFTSSDHAERDVLENTVVGKECKEPFTINRRRPGSRPFIGNFSKSDVTMTGSFVVNQSASGHVVAIQTNLVRELNLFR